MPGGEQLHERAGVAVGAEQAAERGGVGEGLLARDGAADVAALKLRRVGPRAAVAGAGRAAVEEQWLHLAGEPGDAGGG
jgi:hypothetical protein